VEHERNPDSYDGEVEDISVDESSSKEEEITDSESNISLDIQQT
jgi:hypothetical protein